eukprot:IDg2836t1
MWTEICNVHQRHTLLNKLSARRDFYTATMRGGERMLNYLNRVRQMASVLESMRVEKDDEKLAMAVLNGLPAKYQPIITALDAIGDEDASFNLEKVRSRLLQGETRSSLRNGHAPRNSNTTLFNRGKHNHRIKSKRLACTAEDLDTLRQTAGISMGGHLPEIAARSRGNSVIKRANDTAAITSSDAKTFEEDNESEYVCLMTAHNIPKPNPDQMAIDSCATSHITYNRAILLNYSETTPFSVEMGYESTSTAVGYGDVILKVVVNGVTKLCKLQSVLYVQHSHTHLFRRSLNRNLYEMNSVDCHTGKESAFMSNMQLWHERLGHVHNTGIINMAKKGIVKGLKLAAKRNDDSYVKVVLQVKCPELLYQRRAAPVLVTCLNLSIQISQSSLHYPWEAQDTSKFKKLVETEKNLKIRYLRSDGGGEYLSNEFTQFLADNGIQHQKTCAYKPQQME